MVQLLKLEAIRKCWSKQCKSCCRKKKKIYTTSKKEKTIPIYDEEPKRVEEVVELNKPISNGKEALVLDEEETEETPLILDQEHKTEKIKKIQIKKQLHHLLEKWPRKKILI